MQIKLIRFFEILILLGAMTACATDGGSKPLTETQKQMNHIYAAAKVNTIYFIDVPSPNNYISEKIMLVTMVLDGGGSTAVNALDNYLKKNVTIDIGIVGNSQAINVMTVKQSLKNMAGKPSQGTVYLIADAKSEEELVALNQNKSIKIVVISK